jgi:hypothetical protein
MSLPENPIIPTDSPAPEVSAPTARARRRRATRQAMFPADAEGQAALIASLSRRAYPSLELFVFSLVCGAIVGCGFLLDSQAVLLLGILVTPIMTPWVGFLLAIFTGSPRFLYETLMALLISGVIVFLGGLLTGFAARLFLPMTLDNVFIHARLWYHELFVLSIGAITLVASFARSEDKPFLPSILIAYAFYLPINASGFGLGSGVEGIWPQGLFVFVVHFSLASLLGLITLFVLKLEPTKAGGIASGITMVALTAILALLMFPQILSGASPAQIATPAPAMTFIALPSSTPTFFSPALTPTFTNTPLPSYTPTFTPSVTPNSAITIRATLSFTPAPSSTAGISATNTKTNTTAATIVRTPSITPTATMTLPPSATPTTTPTPQPVLGKINAKEGGGANLRQTPNGKFIMTLENGTVVEVQPDSRTVNGVAWVHVFTTIQGRRMEGWLLASVVVYDNPAQGAGVTPSP